MHSQILNEEQISHIKTCGQILAKALDEVMAAIKPGISGDSLDKIAESAIRRQGGKPSFLNYGEDDNPFPATICLSLNDEVVHGIPFGKTIKSGDLVSVDIGAEYCGVCTDMAKTVIAGQGTPQNNQLLKVTAESLNIGISQAVAGKFTGDIGAEIEKYVLNHNFNVVKSLIGHGIGSEPHQDPPVPNYGKKHTGVKLVPGMAICIEPMVNVGSSDVISSNDGWSIKTHDGKMSAHFEHTVLITKSKPIVITKNKKS